MSIRDARVAVDFFNALAYNGPAKPGQGFETMTELTVISTAQLAVLLGIGQSRIRTWMMRGQLMPSAYIDRKPVFDADAVKKAQALAELSYRPQQRYTRIQQGATTGYVVKKEAADRLCLTPDHLMRLVVDGTIKAYKEVGRELVLFKETEVADLAEQRAGRRHVPRAA